MVKAWEEKSVNCVEASKSIKQVKILIKYFRKWFVITLHISCCRHIYNINTVNKKYSRIYHGTDLVKLLHYNLITLNAWKFNSIMLHFSTLSLNVNWHQKLLELQNQLNYSWNSNHIIIMFIQSNEDNTLNIDSHTVETFYSMLFSVNLIKAKHNFCYLCNKLNKF